MFWIWFYNFVPGAASRRSRAAARSSTVKPENAPPVEVAQQVLVGPSGLAIPVVGIKPGQLIDTFDARAGSGPPS